MGGLKHCHDVRGQLPHLPAAAAAGPGANRQYQLHISLVRAPGLTAYAASKFALEGLTDGLRVELAPFNVKVISVAPGKIDTPIWDKARAASTRIEARQTEDVCVLYRPLMRFYEHYAERERATPMDEVTRAVDHALCAAAPRARYVVGRAARIRVWVDLLPTGVRDAAV